MQSFRFSTAVEDRLQKVAERLFALLSDKCVVFVVIVILLN
jgi:hypothetical protein